MFCPRCGAQLPDGAAFCGSCGSSLRGSAPAAAPASGASSGSALLALDAVVFGAAGAFGLVSFLGSLSDAMRAIGLLEALPAFVSALLYAASSLLLSLGPLMFCARGLLVPRTGATRGRCAVAVALSVAAIAVWALGSFAFVGLGPSVTSVQAVCFSAFHFVGPWAAVSAVVLSAASVLLVYLFVRGRGDGTSRAGAQGR